jgi:hypothetical protein
MSTQKFIVGLVIFINLFTTFSIFAEQTSTGSLTISPTIQEVEAIPGNSYDLAFTVENNSESTPITADVTIETFVEGSIPGSTNVIPFKPENDLSKWIESPKVEEFPQKTITKKPFKLIIPNDAKSGAYFFAVVFQPRADSTGNDQNKSNLILQTRLANLLFVNIGGDSSKQPVTNNLTTNLNLVDIVFDKLTANFDVEVKGNSYYRTAGNVFLTGDSDDITVLTSTLSNSLILPGGKRSFTDCYENHVFNFGFVDNCKKTNTTKLPYFGKKNLEVKLDYINGSGLPQSTTASKQLFFFPYKTLFLIVLLTVLILLIVRFQKRKNLKNKSIDSNNDHK